MQGTETIGWPGTFTGMAIGFPQDMKTARSRSTCVIPVHPVSRLCLPARSFTIGNTACNCNYFFTTASGTLPPWLIIWCRAMETTTAANTTSTEEGR